MRHTPADRPATTVRSLPERAGCRHDAGPDCAFHGCPFCFMEDVESKPWVDACELCHDAREQTHARWLGLNPAAACEGSGCLHCSECQACARRAPVCVDCQRCTRHEVTDPYDQCVRWRNEDGVDRAFVRHTYLNQATQRWLPGPMFPLDTTSVEDATDAELADTAPPASVRSTEAYAALRRVECRCCPGELCVSCGPDRGPFFELVAQHHAQDSAR